MIRGGRFVAGRFARARGNSAWAQAFNSHMAGSSGRAFFSASPSVARVAASINFSACLGETPLTGFAEQFRTVIANNATMSSSDASCEDADAVDVAEDDNTLDKTIKVAEVVPTLFTYCHEMAKRGIINRI